MNKQNSSIFLFINIKYAATNTYLLIYGWCHSFKEKIFIFIGYLVSARQWRWYVHVRNNRYHRKQYPNAQWTNFFATRGGNKFISIIVTRLRFTIIIFNRWIDVCARARAYSFWNMYYSEGVRPLQLLFSFQIFKSCFELFVNIDNESRSEITRLSCFALEWGAIVTATAGGSPNLAEWSFAVW